jgi:hypothetical protein
MPLDATAPGIDALLLTTVLQLELSDRDLRVADKRYQYIPEHLQRPTSRLRHLMDTAAIYAQGSRALGATIVDGTGEDRFDLDAILEFNRPAGWTPGNVLDELHEAFKGFPDVKKIERCTRCIQLQFAFMHLDVTPMDPAREPRPERVGQIFHSPDDGPDECHDVNPFAFIEWFKVNVAPGKQVYLNYVQDTRKALQMPDRFERGQILADADIDELPDPIDPIRDAPQVIALKLIKRYLNRRYANRAMKRPVSIYLSKVAALVPANPNGLCAQLEALATNLERRMSHALATGERPNERNPEFPSENFNDRWPRNNRDVQIFRDDLRHLVSELERSKYSELLDIQKIFDDLFGERISEKAIRAYANSIDGTATQSNYERGKGYLAQPAILSTSAAAAPKISKAKPHHFHPGKLK